MQILEHQTLILHNLISYRIRLDREALPGFIRHCLENIDSLGMQPTGRILFTEDSSRTENIEVLIPVNREPASCPQYENKPVFKLLNAVTARHEGNFSEMDRIEKGLRAYAADKAYQVITKPYYSIVRLDPERPGSAIIDIYLGINSNIL